MTRERPCLHCGRTPTHHSAHYMTCFDPVAHVWLRTQYAPDPSKEGAIPAHKPASQAHLCAFPSGVDAATVRDLTAQMMQARASRDYKLADSIREVLRAAGIKVANGHAHWYTRNDANELVCSCGNNIGISKPEDVS